MTIIAHSFSEQTTRQTVVGTTYTTVLSHASGNFTAGGKYLIMVTALCDLPVGATDHIRMRTIHGATAFADSEYVLEPSNANKRYNYSWFKVWTAVGGEAIDFQISCSNVAATVGADQICIFAMRLDADLIENTDWFFNEVATDSALTTTPLDGASVTFTPTVSTNWLVLSTAQLDVDSLTVNYATRIQPSGTYSDAVPKWSREGEDVAETFIATLGRVFEDVGAVSQTFKEQSFNEVGNSGNRLHSAIFALNLNRFRTKAHIYDPSNDELGTILWDDLLGNLSIFPDSTGDVWIVLSGIFDLNSAGNEITHRLTVDEVDQPATQTTDQYAEEEGADDIDELAVWRQTVENLSATIHDISWEAEASASVNGPEVRDKMMVAITMELGGDVPAFVTIPHEALGYVDSSVTIAHEGGVNNSSRILVTDMFDVLNFDAFPTVEGPPNA